MAEKDRYDVLISIAYTLMSSRYGFTRDQLRQLVDDYRSETNEENFERKFERDKLALRNLGFVLRDGNGRVLAAGQSEDDDAESESESESMSSWQRRLSFNYRIDPRDYALPALSFSTTEAALLGLAAQAAGGGELGRQASRAALRLGVSDAEAGPPAFRPRIDTADARLADLLRHVMHGSPVTFTYRTESGAESERVVTPWGLGHRDGHWYLAAGDSARDGERLFRVDRIRGGVARATETAEAYLAEAYGRTDRFDMRQRLERLADERPQRQATLLASGVSGGAVAARALHHRGVPAGEELVVEYTDADDLVPELAAEGLSVVRPAELAGRLADHLERALAAQRRDPPHYTVRRHGGGRVAVEVQVARALDLVAYVSAHQGDDPDRRVPFEDLRSRFDLNAEQLVETLNRLSLCGVPGGLHDELLDVDVEGDGVRIGNAEALAAPMNLSLAEAAAVLIGLDALAAAPGESLGSSARTAVTDLAARLRALRPGELDDFDRIVAVTAASEQPGRIAAVLAEAIADRAAVDLVYAGPGGVSRRRVEPVQLVEENARLYLRAWCRRREDARVFRLDRILDATVDPTDHDSSQEHRTAALTMDITPTSGQLTADVIFTGAWASRADAYRPERRGKVQGELAKVDGTDSVAARLLVTGIDHLVGLVASAGSAVTVAGPPETRAAVQAGLELRLEAVRRDAGIATASPTP